MLFLFRSLLCLLAVLALSGCHRSPLMNQEDSQPSLSHLQSFGIQTITMGDTVRIIIPARDIFMPQAQTRVMTAQQPALLELAKALKSYKHNSIRVVGYTNNMGSSNSRFNRSFYQAESVAAYLWNAGIPIQQITVVGMGSEGPVSSNATPEGSAANSRVEILIN